MAVVGCGEGAGASRVDPGPGGEGEAGEGEAGGEGEGEAGGEGEGEAGEGEDGAWSGEVTPVTPGEPIDVNVETLVEGGVASVAAWPGGWVAEGPDGLKRFDGDEISSLGEGPVGLSAAAPFGGGVLLASSTGLWFVGDGAPALSPLNDALDGALDLALRGDELWIAGAQGVHRWRGGELVSVRLGGSAPEGVRLAMSGPNVWVLADGVLWRLWEAGGEGWRAQIALASPDFIARWVAAGPSGDAWVSDGTWAVRVSEDDAWAYAFPEHVGLSAAGDDLWAWSADTLWRWSGDALWPVAGVGGVMAVAPQGSGSALVVGASGLVRIRGDAPPPERAPTWNADVKPLFEAACEMCHGARSNARRLETRGAFAADIDPILAAVREGRMPLPPNEPLTADDIEMLDRWRRADFPE